MEAEQCVAEVHEDSGFSWGEQTVCGGASDFGKEAMDVRGSNRAVGGASEFASEIGGAKAAARGVRVVVAEAVALRIGGECAAAAVGEGVAAEGKIERVLALARHGESIANDKSMEK
jgi:hypothetical protein